MAAHLFVGLTLAGGIRAFRGRRWHHHASSERLVRWWHQRLGRIIGMKIRVRGTPACTPTMIAANHISWLDVVAIASVSPVRFVSKSEVRNWPLIGSIAALCGTIFLRRGRVSGLAQAIETIADILTTGQSVVIFPEATTSMGDSVVGFHSAMFEAAINAGAPIQAVAIGYVRDGAIDRTAPFVGDAAFIPHLIAIMARPATTVELSFCPPHTTVRGADRRILAQHARNQILDVIEHRSADAVPEPTHACLSAAGNLPQDTA